MFVMATFEYTTHFEMALSKLNQKGIKKEQIIAVPLNRRQEEISFLDTIHHADGKSLIDLACILGTIFGFFGAIYGFVLEWGPVIWGIIGFLIAFSVGILIDLLFRRRNKKRQSLNRKLKSEVVLTIECSEEHKEMVEEILWSHNALGIGHLEK
jgi:large-conductance mechanosensitive channel